jgi:hypothetical protein
MHSDIGVKHSYLGMTFLFEDGRVKINMDGYTQMLASQERQQLGCRSIYR